MRRPSILLTPRNISVDRAKHDGVRTLDEVSGTPSLERDGPHPAGDDSCKTNKYPRDLPEARECIMGHRAGSRGWA